MTANLTFPEETLKKTALFELHCKAGARFTCFGGWKMPVQYRGLIQEHQTVRSAVGLFDVSHMGEIAVKGKEALAYLQHVASNDVSKLRPGFAQYSLLLNSRGGVVDDIIIYMMADNDYLLCVNAANTTKDFAWMTEHNSFETKVLNVSNYYAQIAVQGPLARRLVRRMLGVSDNSYSVEKFPSFSHRSEYLNLGEQKVVELIVACTGYTGEDGFELFCPTDDVTLVWERLLDLGNDFGAQPIGLGARDTLRLEACLPLHGHEISDDITPTSAGLDWAIKLNKGDFIGREALLQEREGGPKVRLVGLEVIDPGIIRQDCRLFDLDCNKDIGWVTSGTKTPTLNKAVALGFVSPEYSQIGTELFAEVRGKKLRTKVVQRPFYKRSKN